MNDSMDYISHSHFDQHLLILDGHNSHITLETIQQAKDVGLDLPNLPTHTFHEFQHLDVSVFKSFKIAFCKFRDILSLAKNHKFTQKEDLAQWVSLALQKSMTRNILKGFKKT
jgi:hypothetical protein